MKILLVDDAEGSRVLLYDLLTASGYEVKSADNSNQALDLIDGNFLPDLVLSNILMLERDSHTFYRKFKKDDKFHSISFIFYIATYPGDKQFSLNLEIELIQVKPIKNETFLKEIKLVLDKNKVEAPVEQKISIKNVDEIEKDYSMAAAQKLERKVRELEEDRDKLQNEITERKKKEEDLRRYEHILSTANDLMSFLDRNYIYREVNKTYLYTYKKTREEIIGHSVVDLFGIDVFEQTLKERLDRCLAGEGVRYQQWFDFPGRERKYMDVGYHPYIGNDGVISGVVVSAHDMTEIKQSEDERMRLLQAIDQSNETIVITSLDATIEYVNPAFEKISGYSREEAIGQNPRILKGDQQSKAFYQQLWKTLLRGEIWRGRFLNKKKDGTSYIEDATISPVFDKLGQVISYIAVKRDVTHEVEMEQQLRQKYKMEAIGVMAGGMAHNFNNNLAIIFGSLELLQRQSPIDDKTALHLKNARTAALRSRDLVKQIMTYSRQDKPNKTPTELPQLIGETLKLLQATIPTTVKVRQVINANSRGITINVDAGQIQVCLINLCNNAVHAMAENGDLTITLKIVYLEATDIPVQCNCGSGSYARISVHDSGCGMDEVTQKKAFDLFFTTKNINEGTGVGLSTVQGIIDQHGGLIKIDSQLGKGSTFELYFPIIDRRQHHRTPETPTIKLPHGSEQILLVDDNEMLAGITEVMLTELGYLVTCMTSSNEALKMFRANAERFDLIISDQTMPEMTGSELLHAAHQIRPDIPTIICTGYSNKIDAVTASALGINAFLAKPLEMKEIAQTVRKVLDEGR